VYWQLEQCSQQAPTPQQQAPTPQQQQQQQRQQRDATMQPRDVLRCISALAGLKYSDAARLAQLLEPSAAAAAAGTQQATPPAPGALGSSTSTARRALLGLRVDQLAALASNLAQAGMRPSNAWLLAFMQVGGSRGRGRVWLWLLV
jgi:hypothetical protein